jgi:hypothetical protein
MFSSFSQSPLPGSGIEPKIMVALNAGDLATGIFRKCGVLQSPEHSGALVRLPGFPDDYRHVKRNETDCFHVGYDCELVEKVMWAQTM